MHPSSWPVMEHKDGRRVGGGEGTPTGLPPSRRMNLAYGPTARTKGRCMATPRGAAGAFRVACRSGGSQSRNGWSVRASGRADGCVVASSSRACLACAVGSDLR